MDWHRRYLHQAQWTRELRRYLFKQAGLNETGEVHRTASLVLEVGCGTGAILSEISVPASLYGLDIDAGALAQCRIHAPSVSLVQGDALKLAYPDKTFDIVYCHFLLLWVRDPLQALKEMKRVVKPGSYVMAFAEPDYTARVDEPPELIPLGQWQTESLRRQGADPGLGARLADLFFKAGIQIIETGTIQNTGGEPSLDEWEMEWTVIETDLAASVSGPVLQKMKELDQQARALRKRTLQVPTHFAWGQV